MTHPTTWINLKIIVLSEEARQKRKKYCMIPHIQNLENVNESTWAESTSELAWEWGMGAGAGGRG